MGHWLTATTIQLCLLSYVLALICWVSNRRGARYRWLWSTACVFLWAHMAFAFHFYHQWSHTAAFADTAAQTEALLGIRFGAGIWFNYALVALWTADVVREWSRPPITGSAASYFCVLVHTYAFFIIFNGAVVFKDGLLRWSGVVATIWVARMAWSYRHETWGRARRGVVHD